MSSTSTGCGDAGQAASGVVVSSVCAPTPLYFLMVVMCVSFFAFVADPSTNTNLASRSFAMASSLCSLAWSSTLGLACGGMVLRTFFNILASMACIILANFFSRSSSLMPLPCWSWALAVARAMGFVWDVISAICALRDVFQVPGLPAGFLRW